MSETPDFFVAGGTLRANDPSYVTRLADHDLWQQLQAGEFCYVLTPRQMGKSSLMVRTAQRLRAEGTRVAVIDLTSIGTGSSDLSMDQWYLGLLSRVRAQLRLATDVQVWWDEHAALGVAQRFIAFLHDVLLTECSEPVVILIDEIDSTLNLNFRDDFFAAIRAVYNERATDLTYQRLTFALFGVATPTDLIQDRERTPFNIGRRIDLSEFTLTDAQPLRDGLAASFPTHADTILQRIFYWTNGHPYLTQKLCQVLQSEKLMDAETTIADHVDDAVQNNFFSEEGRKDSNLTFVQDRIAHSPNVEKRRMLQLYQRVQRNDNVPDDDRSLLQNRLELYGLINVVQGQLQVRNRIYQRVFDRAWLESVKPVDRRVWMAVMATVGAIALVVNIVAWLLLRPSVECSVYQERFLESDSSDIQLSALADLFDRGCREIALDLFYEMNPDEHQELFLSLENPANVQDQLVSVIDGVYRTLDTVPEHDLVLMDIWINVLQNSGLPKGYWLVSSIGEWERSRKLYDTGNYSEAVNALDKAMISDHLSIYYDHSRSLIEQGKYAEALADLNAILEIMERTIPEATPVLESKSTLVNTQLSIVTEAYEPDSHLSVTHSVTPSNLTDATVTPNDHNNNYTSLDYQRRFKDANKIQATVYNLIESNQEVSSYLFTHVNEYPNLGAKLNTIIPQIIREEAVSFPLKPNAIDIWVATIKYMFNPTGRVSDNTMVMTRRDLPAGVICDVAELGGSLYPKQYEEWQLICTMDGFRTIRSMRLNGTAVRGLTGGGYYSEENPYTVYGEGIWPEQAYDLTTPIQPSSTTITIPTTPTTSTSITVSAVISEPISFPLKPSALNIWLALLQQLFNPTGRISDNTIVMTRRDIPQGVTCDVAAVDRGWFPKQYEEWQLMCSMDGFRTNLSLRLNGTAVRGLTGGGYYTAENPFTVYGLGGWPEQSYDSIKPVQPFSPLTTGLAISKDLTKSEIITFPLKLNAFDIWVATVQQIFNPTGKLSDNTMLMARRDIPSGVTCDMAAVANGWFSKQYEEWQLTCSMDGFRTIRRLRLNGTAVRGLTGGGYYEENNPYTVYGDGFWPEQAYDSTKPTMDLTGNWTGSYFNNKYLKGIPVYTRLDTSVNFDWGGSGPGNGISNDKFSASWQRSIYIATGTYRFYATSDDGVRVYVDGYLIIDAWREQASTNYFADIYLIEGYHQIRVEYYEEGGAALIRCWWNKL